MAIISCPICRKSISSEATCCPHCGSEASISKEQGYGQSQKTTVEPSIKEFEIGNSSQNDAAGTGLILGLISLFAWYLPLVGLPLAIVGLVLSFKGLPSKNVFSAKAGIVLNIIGLVATIINSAIGAYKGANGLL